MPQKEIEETRNHVIAASQRIIADNIERMKKADPHRPEAMKYFDEMANLFGQRPKEIARRKRRAKKSSATCASSPQPNLS